MILVFGGAYQGKLAYALDRFSLTEADVYHCDEEGSDAPGGRQIVCDLEKWILAMVKADMDSAEAVQRFIRGFSGAAVTCCDISCGVVPTDPVMRKWREATGRSLAEISQVSDEVIRLYCGIPSRIK